MGPSCSPRSVYTIVTRQFLRIRMPLITERVLAARRRRCLPLPPESKSGSPAAAVQTPSRGLTDPQLAAVVVLNVEGFEIVVVLFEVRVRRLVEAADEPLRGCQGERAGAVDLVERRQVQRLVGLHDGDQPVERLQFGKVERGERTVAGL